MSKYIDAGKLLKEASKDGAYGYVSAEQIANFPTADVAEIKRGRWIKNDGRYGWHCSVCGEDDLYAFAWNSDTGENELQDHYCPNCGARLDEVGE